MCKAIDPWRFSSDLPQGGLEVPCRLAFHGTRTVFSPFYRMSLYQSIVVLSGINNLKSVRFFKLVLRYDYSIVLYMFLAHTMQ